jgi:hypothetical protein
MERLLLRPAILLRERKGERGKENGVSVTEVT